MEERTGGVTRRPDGLVVGLWRRRTMRRAPDLRGRAPSDVDPPEVQSQDARKRHHSARPRSRPSTRWHAAACRREQERSRRPRSLQRRQSPGRRPRPPPLADPPGGDGSPACGPSRHRRPRGPPAPGARSGLPPNARPRSPPHSAAAASRLRWRVHAGWSASRLRGSASGPRGCRVRARWRVRARRRCVRLARRRSRTERHQLLAGSEPVAREAYHLAPRLSLSLFCLGLPTFPQPVDALFQRFLRRRRQCRPSRAVL